MNNTPCPLGKISSTSKLFCLGYCENARGCRVARAYSVKLAARQRRQERSTKAMLRLSISHNDEGVRE